LINLVVEQKTLGWDTQMDLEKKIFRKPWNRSYSIEELPKMSFENEMGDEYPRLGGRRIL
jgi:hypothetical protein